MTDILRAAEQPSNDLRRRIVITGFMGAGKTVVACALAQRLNCTGTDLDEEIAARYERSVQELIDVEGLTDFRRIETNVLTDVLRKGEAKIIALGGGAWTLAHNRALIAQHDCLTVWLDAPFDLCWQRIAETGDVRPLARNKHKARMLYDERRAVYQLATVRVEVTAETSVAKVASSINAALRQ